MQRFYFDLWLTLQDLVGFASQRLEKRKELGYISTEVKLFRTETPIPTRKLATLSRFCEWKIRNRIIHSERVEVEVQKAERETIYGGNLR